MGERCMLYVDGYNFYYAVKKHPAVTPIHLAWCDFGRLAREHLLATDASLVGIRYFTAPVGRFGKAGGEGGSEARRQSIWLSAVRSISGVTVIEGVHTGDPRDPRSRKEKETDVNIAVRAILDGAQNRYDRAILLTGDRDQRPTVLAIISELGKRAEVWLAPGQDPGVWASGKAVPGVRVGRLTPPMMASSRLPERVVVDGHSIDIPSSWRAPR